MINSKQIQRPQMILVVDDQEINRDLLCDILEGKNYELIYAENGKEALEQMRANIDELSIVLLDLRMPVMNGMETGRQLHDLFPSFGHSCDNRSDRPQVVQGTNEFFTHFASSFPRASSPTIRKARAPGWQHEIISPEGNISKCFLCQLVAKLVGSFHCFCITG